MFLLSENSTRLWRLFISMCLQIYSNIIYIDTRADYTSNRHQYKNRRPLTLYHLNSLRPRQNGRHFADDIFKCIFLNENVWIPIKISLKFVPKSRINNMPTLVQIMAWRRSGDKPLSEPMVVSLPTHICVTRPQWVNTRTTKLNVCQTWWLPHVCVHSIFKHYHSVLRDVVFIWFDKYSIMSLSANGDVMGLHSSI